MRLRQFRRFIFTPPELAWLAEQSLTNELAANILVRWNKKYNR